MTGKLEFPSRCGKGEYVTMDAQRKKVSPYGNTFVSVGMGRFELPAPRPPDEYSNLAELHPELV